MNIVFRADASVRIGSGHVMRCATLAEELRRRGAAVSFICRRMPGDYTEWLRSRGIPVQVLPECDGHGHEQEILGEYRDWLGVPLADEILQVRECLVALGRVDWLVVDHYALDGVWEQAQRPHVAKLLAIDDLANRTHDCDLLVDQNYHHDAECRYEGLLPEGCTALLGPGYALLRPQFLDARERLRERTGRVGRLMVFFGGGDPNGDTLKAVAALKILGRTNLAVDVVIGNANPHRATIAAACASLPGATLYCQVDNIASVMAPADIFLGAGGTSSWERCCLGLPGLVCAMADNQVAQSKALADAGVQIYLGPVEALTTENMARHLAEILEMPELLLHMTRQGFNLVDGLGIQRIATLMEKRI